MVSSLGFIFRSPLNVVGCPFREWRCCLLLALCAGNSAEKSPHKKRPSLARFFLPSLSCLAEAPNFRQRDPDSFICHGTQMLKLLCERLPDSLDQGRATLYDILAATARPPARPVIKSSPPSRCRLSSSLSVH